MECKFCNRKSKNKNSHMNHERMCSKNPNRNPKHIGRGKMFTSDQISWNKGLTKETDERIKRGVETFYKNENEGLHSKDYYKTDDYRNLKSRQAIDQGFGGTTKSRTIYYKGIALGSTYEFHVAQSLDENQIHWTKPTRFYYTDINGKKRTYTPDFYLNDYDVYLDPKNDFLINNSNPSLGFKDSDKIKWVSEQNDICVIILNKNGLSWNEIQRRIILVRGESRL